VPSYVLSDASLFQDNLKSFEKVSFEKEVPNKTLILGVPEDDEVPSTDGGLSAPVDCTVEEIPTNTGDTEPVPSNHRSHTYVLVKDFVTGMPVPNARVAVDGAPFGFTDDFGWIYVSYRQQGVVIPIEIKAQGYKDSGDDTLENDSFILPVIGPFA